MRAILLALFLAVASALTPASAQQWTKPLPDVAALRAEPAPATPEGWVSLEGVNVYGHANARDRKTLERLMAASMKPIMSGLPWLVAIRRCRFLRAVQQQRIRGQR